VAEVAEGGAAPEQAANAARSRAAPRLPTIRRWNEFRLAIHVSHLRKLDLRDRAQLVVLAYESSLVRPGALPGEET
jgi:hypothetical protein